MMQRLHSDPARGHRGGQFAGALSLACLLASVAQPVAAQGAPSGTAPAPVTAPSAAAMAEAPTATATAIALSLGAAEARLESGNRDIIAARQELEIAKSGVLSAGAVPNPTLSASMTSINPTRGIGAGRVTDKQVDSVLRVDQVIERGGKRELRIASAEQSVAASGQDLEEVRRQQRLLLQLAYYDLKLAGERLAITRENSRLQTQALQASERRLAAGDVAAAEVIRLRVEALRASNELSQAGAELTRARQALQILIGAPAVQEWVASDPWPADLPANLQQLDNAEAVANRPGVRAAQFRVAAADRARELARQLRTRDVSVGAQVERFPPDSGLAYGFSISVPLHTNYQYEGEIARAEADLTAAMLAREREALTALAEARRAAAEVQAAAERRQRLRDELLPQARQALESAEFAYQRGASSLIDVLDARRTQRSVELEAAAAEAEFARARAGWYAATGAPATPAR